MVDGVKTFREVLAGLTETTHLGIRNGRAGGSLESRRR